MVTIATIKLFRNTKNLFTQRRCINTGGYKSIGSFHSEDVDELMTQKDDVYELPVLPFLEESFRGKSDISSDFLLDREKWTFLNHGAFGAALRVGYNRAEKWRYYLEQQPLRYFDRDLLPHLVYSARRLAHFCHASRTDLTLIPNVTYGLNTVLRGYHAIYGENSHVMFWDTSYGSLKKMAHKYSHKKPTEIPLSNYFDQWWSDLSESPEDVFERALLETVQHVQIQNNHHQIENSILIIDHVTSNTALRMPIEKLSKLAKEMNMLVMVDGAHGLLAEDFALNQQALPHVDFYVGNCHKWLSCPRGIGFLYCPHSHLRDSILAEPAVISHGIGQGFQSRFLWDGCRDYAAALSIPPVLDFWEQKFIDNIGAAPLRNMINNRLQEATNLLTHSWHGDQNLERSLLAPFELHSPTMALVRLPSAIQSSPSTSIEAKAIQDFLYDNFIEVPIKCIRGVLYARISYHIYNEMHEYQRLADTMLKFPRTLR